MNQTQDAYNRSANAGPYNAQNFGNQYGSGPQFQNMGLGYLAANAPQLNNYQMGPADQVSGNNVNNQNINAAQSGYQANLNNYQMGPASQVRSQNFGQQFAQDYMSPYQQNVTDFQKQEAVKDYSRALPGMGSQASGAGAFGGTRHALVAAEGQRNLQNQLGGIQAAGSQNAYQNAQQQFNADQARRSKRRCLTNRLVLLLDSRTLDQGCKHKHLALGRICKWLWLTCLTAASKCSERCKQSASARHECRTSFKGGVSQPTGGSYCWATESWGESPNPSTGFWTKYASPTCQSRCLRSDAGSWHAAEPIWQSTGYAERTAWAQYGLAGMQAGEQSTAVWS
jgi:hypothetical protein